jgi:O-antigen ligase
MDGNRKNVPLSRLCDRAIECGWLIVVLVVPLYFNVYSYRVFEPDKVALFRSLVLIMALAWLIKEADTDFGHRFHGCKLRCLALLKCQAPESIVLALVGVYLLATLTSLAPGLSLWGSYEWRQGTYTFLCYVILFFLVACNLRSEAQVGRLLTAVLFASLFVSLYGILQHFDLDPLPWQGIAVGRVFSTMNHPNFLGAYLTMVIPLTVGCLLNSSLKPGLKPGCALLLALQIVCLLFTFSRSSWLAFLVSILVFAFLGALGRGKTGRFLIFVIALTCILLILAGLAYLDPGGLFSYSPLEPVHSFLRGKSAAAQIRALGWGATVRLIGARPVLGYGPESFALAFAGVYPPRLAIYGGPIATGGRAHNEWLDLAVIIGVPGVALYLLVLAVVFRRGWKARDSANPRRQAITIALLSAIAAYLAQNQLSFGTVTSFSLLWLFMAVIVALEKIQQRGVSGPTLSAPLPTLPGGLRVIGYGTLTAFVLVFVVLTNGVPVVADIYARQGAMAATAGGWDRSIEAYKQALRLCPNQGRYHRFLAAGYLNRALTGDRDKGHFLAAETELLTAVRLSPFDLGYRLALGGLYYQWGLLFDTDRLGLALEAYHQAAELSPTNPDVYTRWGLVYHALKRYDEALEKYHQALRLDPYHVLAYTCLGDTYTALGKKDEALGAYKNARRASQVVDTLVSKR